MKSNVGRTGRILRILADLTSSAPGPNPMIEEVRSWKRKC